jgi:hypothetical protein
MRKKEDEKKKGKERGKKKGESYGKPLFQGLEGSVLRNVLRLDVVRYATVRYATADEPVCRSTMTACVRMAWRSSEPVPLISLLFAAHIWGNVTGQGELTSENYMYPSGLMSEAP